MKKSDQLRNDVEQALACEPNLDERRVMIGVNDGAVTLGGRVPTFAQKVQAVRAVERVAGVRAVADELQVRLESSHGRDDTDIAESVAHQLAWNSVVPPDSVQAEVENGNVILRGTVESESERDEAARLAQEVLGVHAVRNLVTLTPPPTAKMVERQIASAFGRQASLDARGIHVTVHDSTAVLTGSVRSLAEQRIAREAAIAAPGILAVESNLTIEL